MTDAGVLTSKHVGKPEVDDGPGEKVGTTGSDERGQGEKVEGGMKLSWWLITGAEGKRNPSDDWARHTRGPRHHTSSIMRGRRKGSGEVDRQPPTWVQRGTQWWKPGPKSKRRMLLLCTQALA